MISSGFVVGALSATPVLAATEADTGTIEPRSAVDAVLARWGRIAAFEAAVRVCPIAARPSKTDGDDRWDRERWDAASGDPTYDRYVIARFAGGDFSLSYRLIGDALADESISMVNGEFVQWLSEMHNGPAAFVLDHPKAARFASDRILTVFEQAMFDTQDPWPIVFDRLGMRFAGAEELDSMPSWRLVNSRDVEKFQVTVWVSTDHDLAPLRVRQVHLAETGEETAESEMRVTAYTPVGDSFLPASVIICGTNRYVSSYQMSTYDIEEVKVGPQHRPSSVLADLPRGTYVTDLVRMEHWTVGENGARANRQPVNLERRRAVEMARDAQVNLPRLKRTRGISIFLIGLGTAGIVVFTILAMRRRARA